MDSLTYCFIPTGASEVPNYLHFVREKDHIGYPIQIAVPNEINEIAENYFDEEILVTAYEFPVKVRQVLSLLREKLKARTNIDVDSNRDNLTEIDNKQRIITPKLTNAGRTLVCSKGTFDFTAPQAIVVKIMLEKGFNSQEFYSEQAILDEAKMSKTSFANVFKSRRKKFKVIFEQHKTMKDCWRLNLGQADD